MIFSSPVNKYICKLWRKLRPLTLMCTSDIKTKHSYTHRFHRVNAEQAALLTVSQTS